MNITVNEPELAKMLFVICRPLAECQECPKNLLTLKSLVMLFSGKRCQIKFSVIQSFQQWLYLARMCDYKSKAFQLDLSHGMFPTCLARFLASSSRRPLSTDRCTTFSQRPWTLSRRFLINTTSCFWLKYLRCVPVLSSSMIWSRCEFTSVTNTCKSSRSIWRKKERKKCNYGN